MSRIEKAIHGLDNKIKEFLLEEGFVYKDHSSFWQYSTIDSQDKSISVEISSSCISVYIYNNEGELKKYETFFFGSDDTFEEAYEKMIGYLQR